MRIWGEFGSHSGSCNSCPYLRTQDLQSLAKFFPSISLPSRGVSVSYVLKDMVIPHFFHQVAAVHQQAPFKTLTPPSQSVTWNSFLAFALLLKSSQRGQDFSHRLLFLFRVYSSFSPESPEELDISPLKAKSESQPQGCVQNHPGPLRTKPWPLGPSGPWAWG